MNDNLIENNHEVKLVISGETIRCHKVRRILLYHVPNKLLPPDKFAHHMLLLFYPFRDEKELLPGFPPLYQNQLQQQRVQNIVNKNKLKFGPYGDLVDQVYSKFNETFIDNQDPHSQTENDETPEADSVTMKMIQKTQKLLSCVCCQARVLTLCSHMDKVRESMFEIHDQCSNQCSNSFSYLVHV